MTRPDVLQIGSYPADDQSALERDFTMHRYLDAADKAGFLAGVAPMCRAIATRGDLGAGREMLNACPQLEMVAVFGVGTDAVDLDLCRARGIRVTNTPGVLTDDVADLAVGMMLAQARGVVGADAWVRSGAWAAQGSFALQRKVSGRRAGILGLGRIGLAVARRLVGFGMPIAYCSPQAKETPVGWTYQPDPVDLAAQSDVLFVTLAATPATRHIVGAAVLAALGPAGMLINVSRAANVDEAALLAALESGALGSAALDVFEGEPTVDPRFLTAPNMLLQPHAGSGTVETRAAMGRLVRDNLRAHFAGAPLLTPVV